MRKIWFAVALCIMLLLSGCAQEAAPTDPAQCQNHVDANDNGLCDNCARSVVVVIDFYGINDLHGKIADADTHPGVDELTTYLKNARRTDEHAVFLSVGDMWQGSAESNLTAGHLTTEWMNELNFAAMTLGNHEFDWGEEPISSNYQIAQFPFLAINIYDTETDAPVEYCQSSMVLRRDGVEIGIIGAMGDCYSSIAADKVEQVYFKTGDELTGLVKAEAQRLRGEGVDFIVYVLHDGFGQSKSNSVTSVDGSDLASYYDTSLSDGYVDLVFEGHTHQRYLLQDEYGVYHLQNGGDNKGITHVEVAVNTANQTSDVRQAELVTASEYALLEDDPLVEELLDKYEEQIAPALRVVGTNAAQRQRNTLRQLVADLYYRAGMEKWGEQYDIVLGGGFISVRDPGYLAKGEVTYGMLQGLFPFDNELVLCSIQGSDLRSRFFESTNSNYFLSYEEYGRQVKDAIDPDATYYVVVDTYSSTYAPNGLTVVEEYGAQIYARDLLADFMENGGLA